MAEPQDLSADPTALGNWIRQYDTWLFDCDGVLWEGSTLLPKVAETLAMLVAKGKQLIFVTNNSTKSRADYVAKFASLGITVEEDQVIGSGYSVALYLKSVAPLPAATPRVYVLGTAGLEAELHAAGIPTAGGESEPSPMPTLSDSSTPAVSALTELASVGTGAALHSDVGAVLLGLDPRLTYARIAAAMTYARREGVRLLATNEDPRLPSPGGGWLPGSGAIMECVCTAVGRRPDVVLGKPEPAMMGAVEARWPFEKARACMVGDRLETDIVFARRGGLGGALLVLSGVAKEGDWRAREREQWPDAYLKGVADLLDGA